MKYFRIFSCIIFSYKIIEVIFPIVFFKENRYDISNFPIFQFPNDGIFVEYLQLWNTYMFAA